MIQKLVIVMLLVMVASLNASAQEIKVVVTPLLEASTYTRSVSYDDETTGYDMTSSRSRTTQKGFQAEFVGDGAWSTMFRYTTGSVGTPTFHNRFTDGHTSSHPYNISINSDVEFTGNSQSLEITEEYTRGLFKLRFGVVYRILEHTDQTTIYHFEGDVSYSESEVTDSYFGPRFGITAHKKFNRLGLTASVDGTPWMYHGGSYEFRLRNHGNYLSTGTTSSNGFDLELGSSFQVMKYLGVTGGWRYAALNTINSGFVTANPFGGKPFPQKDSWKGFYLGIQIIG